MTDTSASLSQPLYGATIGQAVNRFFKKYATFSGRASLSEYWWVALVFGIVNVVLSIIFFAAGGIGAYSNPPELPAAAIVIAVIWLLFELAIIVPTIAVTVRRLHDGNFSGLFYLLSLIGLSIVVFILTLLPSKPEGARFDA